MKQFDQALKQHEAAIKTLPEGKELLSLLKKLAKLKKEDNPHPYLERIMMLLSQHLAVDIVPTLFPVLVALTLCKQDFALLNFTINLKLGFYHRGSLDPLTDTQLLQYVQGVSKLTTRLPLLYPSTGLDWSDDFKTMYLWNALLLYGQAQDLLVISRNGRFSAPVKVKCTHCGNDIHSLCIDGEEMSRTSHITPAPIPVRQEEVLFFDDIYQSFYQVFEIFQETHFTTILPYLYGTYQCSQCHQTNQVMSSMKAAQFEKDPPPLPSEELLTRIETLVLDHTPNLHDKWLLIRLGRSLCIHKEGEHSLRGMLLVAESAYFFPSLMTPTLKTYLLDTFPLLLERPVEASSTKVRGQLLYYYAQLLFDPEERTANRHKLTELYQEMIPIFEEAFGETHNQTLNAKVCYGNFLSKTLRNGKDKELLRLYNQLSDDQTLVKQQIELYLSELYVEEEDFEQAILFKKKTNHNIASIVGGDSQMYVAATRELAKLYLSAADHHDKAINLQAAIDHFQKAFDINVKELGREYLLPPLLRDMAHGVKKLTKSAKEDKELTKRVQMASASLADMGHIAFRLGDYKEALKQYEKAMELWDWVTDVPCRESGEFRYHTALTYEGLHDKAQSLLFCKKAIQYYEICLSRSPSTLQEDILTHAMDNAQDLLRRLEQD